MKKIRILVVDDSAIVRKLLTENLSRFRDFEVVGTATDAYVARRKILELNPDVLTLDIEMPRMDGITFLKHLMKSYPLPVVIVSSLLAGQDALAMTALELGAVDVVPKPGGPFSIGEVVNLLGEKIRAASLVRFDNIIRTVEKPVAPAAEKKIFSRFVATKKLLAVGASTGGTIALEKLFASFTPDMPPVVTVIHMPQGFTDTFAKRLDSICACAVKEAADGDKLQQGTIYIAPGNFHMTVKLKGTDFYARIATGPKINSCRPAVDVLFDSVAEQIGRNSCGILLTGMGRDGAKGLLNIKNNGGFTIAQDEETSIVFGMPKEAIELGAADKVLPLQKIHSVVLRDFLNN